MKKAAYSIFTGLIFLVVGIGYLGKTLAWWPNFTIFFPGWWTLFLLIPAVFSFIHDGFNFGNLVLFGVGIALLVSRLPFLNINTGMALAIVISVFLILVGLRILFSPLFKKRQSGQIASDGKFSSGSVCFSEKFIDESGHEFHGASYSANFGSIQVNLRHAVITEDTFVDVSVNFGDVKIYLPDNVCLKDENGSTFCGEIKNKHFVSNTGSETCHTLTLRAHVNFGGVQIF